MSLKMVEKNLNVQLMVYFAELWQVSNDSRIQCAYRTLSWPSCLQEEPVWNPWKGGQVSADVSFFFKIKVSCVWLLSNKFSIEPWLSWEQGWWVQELPRSLWIKALIPFLRTPLRRDLTEGTSRFTKGEEGTELCASLCKELVPRLIRWTQKSALCRRVTL